MAKTILLVDDSSSFRQVVSLALRRAGFDTLEAADGLAGLDLLDGRRIHLIVSDINMPRMDGLTFLKEVKKRAGYQFTPVLMLTTETAAGKIAEARAAGAKAWINKPFEPPRLLEVVGTLVRP